MNINNEHFIVLGAGALITPNLSLLHMKLCSLFRY